MLKTLPLGDHREDLAPHRMPEGDPTDSPPTGHPVSQVGGGHLAGVHVLTGL